MHTSEQINELAAALAKAQAAMMNPSKNRTVTVKSDKGNYTFDYATLDAVFDAIKGPLAENGLSFIQALDRRDDNSLRLVTRLMHQSGQWMETETPVTVQGNGMQALGSAQTYARRYAITSLLGIAADEDDDGNTADGNGIENKQDRKPGSNTRKAAPKQDEDPAREEYKRIAKGIDECANKKALDTFLATNGDALKTIKGKSEQAYDQLMERANKKQADLQPQAAE